MHLHQTRENRSLRPTPDTEEHAFHSPQPSLKKNTHNTSETISISQTNSQTYNSQRRVTFAGRNPQQPLYHLPINEAVVNGENLKFRRTGRRLLKHFLYALSENFAGNSHENKNSNSTKVSFLLSSKNRKYTDTWKWKMVGFIYMVKGERKKDA